MEKVVEGGIDGEEYSVNDDESKVGGKSRWVC
jgi:hypothetical protein